MTEGRRAKRFVAALYSSLADTLYEPLIVKGAFRVFGGDLNAGVGAQGRRAAREAAGLPILDMPVGTAFFAVAVAARHDGIVVGADIADGMVREAKRAATAAAASNLVVVQADAHRLPFKDEAFGAVLCSNGLQVIPGMETAVAELARALRTGRSLYVSVVNLPLGSLLGKSRRRLPAFLRPATDVARALANEGLRIQSQTRSRLATLIEAVKTPGGAPSGR